MGNKKTKYAIAVIGTQNTGKSSFIKDLMKYYENNTLVKPFVTSDIDYRKKIEQEGLSINQKGNLRCQKIIFDTLTEQLVKAINDDSVSNFVSDRSPIDAYVYTVWLKENNPDSGITDNDLEIMFDKLTRFIHLYDDIIFIDLDRCNNVKVVDDKFRDTDPKFRSEIDKIFKKTILDLHITGKVNSIIFGSREERIEEFVKHYQEKMVKKSFND